MNRQELFNNAWNGVRAQGALAKSGLDSWHYRYNHEVYGHLRCGLGHSIPDDKYTRALEGDVPAYRHNAPNELARLFEAQDLDDVVFLRELQECHDYANGIENFEAHMRAFAERHGLSVFGLVGS